jgi:acid phosphatase family membrane protein YuiD
LSFCSGVFTSSINDIFVLLSDMMEDVKSPEQKLKELVGHTKLQVFAGCGLGLLVTALSYMIVK